MTHMYLKNSLSSKIVVYLSLANNIKFKFPKCCKIPDTQEVVSHISACITLQGTSSDQQVPHPPLASKQREAEKSKLSTKEPPSN